MWLGNDSLLKTESLKSCLCLSRIHHTIRVKQISHCTTVMSLTRTRCSHLTVTLTNLSRSRSSKTPEAFQHKDSKMLHLASCCNSSYNPPGIKYNVSIAERRFNPRAVLDNPNKLQPQNLTLLPAVETCQHIYFHVMVRGILQTWSVKHKHLAAQENFSWFLPGNSLANKH